ncbi:MAG: helix-turn-helix domain-containing protein [Lachnospiraceae bacterium]|jgi:DNA-binding Xre family transcriptional regulator|nr:helix-turn-helix domain-containing protein [Lachnospiraceae bacterium]
MMKYNKLFALLALRGMKKSDLVSLKIISSPTLAKLSKGESITTTVLCQLCEFLKCQPGDLMEYIPDGTQTDHEPSPQ